MNKNITCVVVNGRNIEVKNGRVLVFTGHGPYDAAFYKKLEDCSDADFNAAKEVEVTAEDFNPTPWGNSLDQTENKVENNTNPTSYKVDNTDFDKAVDFLTRCSGEDFLELVKYAKKHNNTFWHCVSEVADVVNADDAYCSAIIKLARPLGESVEKAAFKLFDEAIEKDEYDFIKLWESLQNINYFCN